MGYDKTVEIRGALELLELDMKSPYARLTLTELLVAGEAVVCLAAASLIIALLPFRTVTLIAGSLGAHERGMESGEHDQLRDCCTAIKRCARRLPWKAVCFQQGLALQMMLRRRDMGSTLHYGVAQTATALKAHVWISVAGRVVIGGETLERFAEVASFPRRDLGSEDFSR